MGVNDKKISDLTELTLPASGDYIEIIDITAGVSTRNKRITMANLSKAIDHTAILNIGTNTHAQIDTHIADATKHRIINDSGTGVTELWSASKINSEISSIDLSAYLNKDGSVALTADWDIGDGRTIIADAIKGRSDEGGVTITTPDTAQPTAGHITLKAGYGGFGGGQLRLYGADDPGSISGGPVYIQGGSSVSGSGGLVRVKGGQGSGGGGQYGGSVEISSGDSQSDIEGQINIFIDNIGTIGIDAVIGLGAAADNVRLKNAPTGAQALAVATVGYVGGLFGDYLKKDGSVALTGDWDIGDGRTIFLDALQDRSDYGGITITTRNRPSADWAGNIKLQCGWSQTDVGVLQLYGADRTDGFGGGLVEIKGGNDTGGSGAGGGLVRISGGNAEDGGHVDIFSGTPSGGNEGGVEIRIRDHGAQSLDNIILFSADADNVRLKNAPTGAQSLAVATTGYVVKKIGSSTDNAVMRWDGAGGATPQDSGVIIDDSNNITIPGNAGIGGTRTEGTLHIITASAGTVTASTIADDLVIENSGDCGISILSPDANGSYVYFGSPTDNIGASLSYSETGSYFRIATRTAGHSLVLRSGDNVDAVTIDSNQDVTFAQEIAVTMEAVVGRATRANGVLNAIRANTASGATANPGADVIVAEAGAGASGISILTADAYGCNLIMGTPTDATAAYMQWKYSTLEMKVGTLIANGTLELQSGDGATALTFDASQDATFAGNVTMSDAKNIILDTTTGTKIGTATTQKLGFYNATPVTQRLKANYNNWAALSDVVNALVALGLFDQA